MSNYVDGIEFVTEECCSCGIPFAMTKDFQRRRLNDRTWFYCPAGHQQRYSGKSKEQMLKEQLAHKEHEIKRAKLEAAHAKRERDAAAKSYKRIRERVQNGVCPCCNRTFQNLLNHMKTEHPEFGSHDILKSLRDAYGLTQAALSDEIGVPIAYISNYERQRPVPAWAYTEIQNWIEGSAA